MVFLGQASNYSAGHVLRQLFAMGSRRDSDNLRQALAKKYHTKPENVALYHTGRSALAVAFRSLLPDGGTVILPGLTCIAVVRAVEAAGCRVVYTDIEPATLQYNFDQLAANCQKTIKTMDKNAKVCYNGIIVAQNTLGLPLDMQKLQQIATKYNFAIVEDLAHCAGRFYPDGREIGTVGQAAALSFGKGKAIDTIEGGAVILREPLALRAAKTRLSAAESRSSVSKTQPLATSHQSPAPATAFSSLIQPTRKPRLASRLRDRWYPFFGAIARGLSRLKLDCYFLGLLLKIHWIERSADAELDPDVRLTHWQAKLALTQLRRLPTGPLRDYALVENRTELLRELRKNGYHLDEIWYDTPVSPARYAEEANFPAKDCPETVKISQQIINLPTWYPEKKLAKARAIIQKYEVKHD